MLRNRSIWANALNGRTAICTCKQCLLQEFSGKAGGSGGFRWPDRLGGALQVSFGYEVLCTCTRCIADEIAVPGRLGQQPQSNSGKQTNFVITRTCLVHTYDTQSQPFIMHRRKRVKRSNGNCREGKSKQGRPSQQRCHVGGWLISGASHNAHSA